MFDRIRRWLGGVFARDGNDEGDSRSGFAGSLLDASVNYAHGQEDGREAVRAMQNVNEEAAKLRDADDRRP